MYASRTRRWLNAIIQLYVCYSTNYSTICVAMTVLQSTFVYLYRPVLL